MKPNILTAGHTMRLLVGAEQLFPSMVNAIDASQTEVRLETFIFDFEASALQIAEALERAASRGVAVYLVMDGIGTPRVPDQWQRRFAQAGVKWHRFSPLGGLGLLNPIRWRRLHRKLCIVDQTLSFCGGINFVDDWLEPGQGRLNEPRYDFALQVQGPLVADMLKAMTLLWQRLLITHKIERGHLRAAGRAWQDVRHDRTPAALPRAPKTVEAREDFSNVHAALLLRDNVRNRSRIERAYRHAIGNAREEIIIANAYFLPGARLRRALIHAQGRGVKVKLLVQGRYDNFMQFHASRPVMAAMCNSGIEVCEYLPSLLHAKVSVIDGKWATVGSSNLDPLSLLLAREANVVFADPALAQALRADLLDAMRTKSAPLDEIRLAQRTAKHRVLDRLAFALMRAILFVTGFRY